MHQPNEDGEIVHSTSVRHRYWPLDETGETNDGLEVKWSVSVVAKDDGPWQLSLRLADLVMWVADVEEMEDLVEGVTRGSLWTSKARLADAEAVPR